MKIRDTLIKVVNRSTTSRNVGRVVFQSLLLISLVASDVNASDCSVTSVGITPINDLGTGNYLGFQGGLYPSGINSPPSAHFNAALSRAQDIVPMNDAGDPDPDGKFALLSIGMSNTSQEFENGFMPLANGDPDKNPNLVIVNGASPGRSANVIIDPDAEFWSTISGRLRIAGLTENQVAVAWFKQGNPAGDTDTAAYRAELQDNFEAIMPIMHDKYPNLQIVYMSSRIYAGYATTNLNPEPYAYESGFVTKWTIESQIAGNPQLNFDPANGPVQSPLLLWGPYMWADGLIPRSDGLIWLCSDLAADGTHPSGDGEAKVGNLLLSFFKTDATAQQWFLAQPGMSDTVAPMPPTNLTAE